MAAVQSLAARILLDVHHPQTRKITIGDFGFLRARQQLEVRTREWHVRILTHGGAEKGPFACQVALRNLPHRHNQRCGYFHHVSCYFYL